MITIETLAKLPKGILYLLILIMISLIGYIDYIAGIEIPLTLFYLIPIIVVTWISGGYAGVAFSIIGIATSIKADRLYLLSSFNKIPLFANGFSRCLIFLIIVRLIVIIKKLMKDMEKNVADRTVFLTKEISKRKLAEDELLEKQFELEEAQHMAGIGSWTFDPAIRKSTWSNGMFHIWGLDPSSGLFPVEDYQKYIHPDDYPQFETVLKEALEHAVPYTMELRLKRPDGLEKTIITICKPLLDSSGKVVKLRGTNQDITERKKMEVVLREQADLLNLTHESILVRTMDNIITFWNKGAVSQYGWEAEEVVGKITTHDLLQTQFPVPIDEINNFILINDFWEGELSHTKRDGSLITVLSRWALQRDKSNVPVAIMEINSDITDRKRAEAEKLILERQFQQAQKLESLGVLSGGIAHDFNNILAVIMGHCSLIDMDYEKARDHVPVIEKAATRAAELCRQMLAYAGKAQFVQSQVNIGELVNEMVKMLRSTIKHNIEIQSTIGTDIPAIQADSSQIRQVAMNLIINAAEAIGDVQGVVQVSLAKTEIKTGHSIKDYLGKLIPPGWYVCLEVTDNGSGMSDETYNRIFEPFYTTKFTGRGLGMSAILGIVTTQGGNLQLFSQVGKGTTFKVYLPLLNSDSAFHEAPSLIKQAEQWRGSGTILLVEDEELIMQVAKAMLMELGFEVIEARNGKEALHIYQQNDYDIVLVMTDMGMPVMDGYNLFLELKRLDAELPIVISSGFGDADITSKISRDDIAGLISKPYNFDLLRNVIRDAVGHAVPKLT